MVAGPTTRSGPTGSIVTAAVTSGSFTPTANSFCVVVVGSTGSASATGARTTSDIGTTHSGGTFDGWTMQQVNGGGASRCGIFVMYSFVGASPGNGTFTLTLGAAPTDAVITVLEFTGVNTTTPVDGVSAPSGVAASSHSTNVTTPPVAADFLCGFGCSRNDADGLDPGVNFTQHIDYFKANPSAATIVQHRTGTTSTLVDISGGNTIWTVLVGLVIKDAGGAPPAPKHKIHTGAGFTDSIRKTYNGSVWTETVTNLL